MKSFKEYCINRQITEGLDGSDKFGPWNLADIKALGDHDAPPAADPHDWLSDVNPSDIEGLKHGPAVTFRVVATDSSGEHTKKFKNEYQAKSYANLMRTIRLPNGGDKFHDVKVVEDNPEDWPTGPEEKGDFIPDEEPAETPVNARHRMTHTASSFRGEPSYTQKGMEPEPREFRQMMQKAFQENKGKIALLHRYGWPKEKIAQWLFDKNKVKTLGAAKGLVTKFLKTLSF